MIAALLFALHLLTVKVTPTMCMTPCTVTVLARVEPEPENRWLVVEMTGTKMNGSSTQLNGSNAPLYHMVQFSELAPGDYAIVAVLYQLRGEVARQRFQVQVR